MGRVWVGLILGLQCHFFGESTGNIREEICGQERVEGSQGVCESRATTLHQVGLLETGGGVGGVGNL